MNKYSGTKIVKIKVVKQNTNSFFEKFFFIRKSIIAEIIVVKFNSKKKVEYRNSNRCMVNAFKYSGEPFTVSQPPSFLSMKHQ